MTTRTMKNITKKQSAEFNKKIIEVILQAGFVVDESIGEKRWQKTTNFGKVSISLHQQGGDVYSIFTRFADVAKAKTIFNCNSFSGKYNFHFFSSQDCMACFEFYLHELEYVEVDE